MDQDWQPVILSKKTTKPKTSSSGLQTGGQKETKFDAAKNRQTTQALSTAKLDVDEIGVIPKATPEMAKQIQRLRMAHTPKLTQVELDRLCNFPSGTVALYEKCDAIVKQDQLNKMSKHLGEQIRKTG